MVHYKRNLKYVSIFFDYYLKFQNDRIKHDDNLDSINEVEFSLSMIFIRVLIKSNNKLAVTCGHKTSRG